jgi:hypothetical protein
VNSIQSPDVGLARTLPQHRQASVVRPIRLISLEQMVGELLAQTSKTVVPSTVAFCAMRDSSVYGPTSARPTWCVRAENCTQIVTHLSHLRITISACLTLPGFGARGSGGPCKPRQRGASLDAHESQQRIDAELLFHAEHDVEIQFCTRA